MTNTNLLRSFIKVVISLHSFLLRLFLKVIDIGIYMCTSLSVEGLFVGERNHKIVFSVSKSRHINQQERFLYVKTEMLCMCA